MRVASNELNMSGDGGLELLGDVSVDVQGVDRLLSQLYPSPSTWRGGRGEDGGKRDASFITGLIVRKRFSRTPQVLVDFSVPVSLNLNIVFC